MLASGAVIKERDELQVLCSSIADAMHAAALREDHAAGVDRQPTEVIPSEAHGHPFLDVVDVPTIGRLAIGTRVIPYTHVRDTLAFHDEVELLGTDVLMVAFDFTGREGNVVEEHHRAAQFA